MFAPSIGNCKPLFQPFSAHKSRICALRARKAHRTDIPTELSRRDITADFLLAGLVFVSTPAWAAEQGIQSSDFTNAALSSAQYREKIRYKSWSKTSSTLCLLSSTKSNQFLHQGLNLICKTLSNVLVKFSKVMHCLILSSTCSYVGK